MHAPGSRRCLLLEVSGAHFGLPTASVREVLPLPFLSRPPGTPALLEGFLNLGGMAIAVLSLKRLFRLPDAPPGPYAHLIVLRDPVPPLAILADRAGGTADIGEEEIMPIAETHSFNGCAEGSAAVGGKTVHLLSPGRLLLEEERARIAELAAMEDERLRGLKDVPS